jgi:protein-tyrosine phosphatase
MRILIVCLGNICRSPIAEGVLKHLAAKQGLDWTIESAGTESYHIGQPPHKYSQKVCKTKGIDISSQKARQFSKADFERFDKIYVMAYDVYEEVVSIAGKGADLSKVDFLLNELNENENQDVPDPWYGGEEGYLPVYELIERACEAVIRKYSHSNVRNVE